MSKGTIKRALFAAKTVRKNYYDGGPVYDEMGNVAVPPIQTYDQPGAIDSALEKVAKVGSEIGTPLKNIAQRYVSDTGQAAQDAIRLAQESSRKSGEALRENRPADALGQTVWQALGVLGAPMSPLTGAFKTAGHYATQLTGNPQFGERVELVGGLMDPSHIGALKAAAPLAGAIRPAIQAGKEASAVERTLNPLGMYSYGQEAAAALPQAKGTPQQLAAMLQKQGVKPEEMFSVGFADEAATNAARSKIEADFAPRVEQAKAVLEGLTPGTPEYTAAERQYKNLASTMRSEMDRALVLSEDWASRPSVTRDEIARHFGENMPPVEETILGHNPAYEARKNAIDDEIQEIARREKAAGRLPSADPRFKTLEEEYYDLIDNKIPKELPTEFRKWQLPGGENYREVLLKLAQPKDPAVEYEQTIQKLQRQVRDLEDNNPKWSPELNQQREALFAEMEKANQLYESAGAPEKRLSFQSAHWEKYPDVLAHLRMSDRVGPNGEKVLHVEEIQSDWAQKGRKEGFRQDMTPEQIQERAHLAAKIRRGNPSNDDFLRMEELDRLAKRAELGIPLAPYVTNTQAWTDLALKRVLKEAADGGYDKVVWTPGIEQARRYDLSKRVNSIAYNPHTHFIQALDRNGKPAINEKVTPEKLNEYLGKEVAEQLLAKEPNNLGVHYLQGLDLEVGGKGMKGYYDKIVPTQISKLLQKMDKDVKVSPQEIPNSWKGKQGVSGSDIMDSLPQTRGMNQEQRKQFWSDLTQDQRDQLFEQYRNMPGVMGHGFTITPKLREAIQAGMPHYAEGGSVDTYPLRDHTDWEESTDYEKNGGKLTHMSPDEYLGQVKPLNMDQNDRKTIHHFSGQMKKGEKLDPVAIYPDGKPNGRHRAEAAKKLGIKEIPVVTWPKKAQGGTIVDRALMLTSKKAKSLRGRPKPS